MLLRAFVIVAIVALQTVFVPVPALAKAWDTIWNNDITMLANTVARHESII